MKKLISALIACFLAVSASATTIYVDANGTGDYPTIQDAIDAANDGDTVLVADGVYTGNGNRDIDFLGKAITVRSENGPNSTIIDCENSARGFYYHSGEDSNSVLEGLTITNGYDKYGGGIYCFNSSPRITDCTFSTNQAGSYGGGIYCSNSKSTITGCTFSANSTKYGGGIYCRSNSSLIITDCIFSANSAYTGGGMYHYQSSPTITNCTFSLNSADSGGGMTLNKSNPIITGCIFSANQADGHGGGMSCNSSSPLINDCTFIANSSRDGGGIYCYNSNPIVTDCIFSGNSNPTYGYGGGIHCFNESRPILMNCTFSGNSTGTHGDVICCRHNSGPTLINCIFWGNGASSYENQVALFNSSIINVCYSDIEGGQSAIYDYDGTGTINWGSGNIDLDPCFVIPGYWDSNGTPSDANDNFYIDGDYHLLGDSPCINTGDPNYVAEPNETDLDGWPRVIGGRVDMGAYEFFLRIKAAMRFTPQAMNPKSKGKWLKAHLILPEGFSVEDVDTNEPIVAQLAGLEIDASHVEVFVNEDDGFVEIEAAFERAAFCGIGDGDDIVEVTVEGQFTDGHHFYGTDSIKVITRDFTSYLGALASHWLQIGCGAPGWCGGVDLDQNTVVDFVDFAMLDGCCIEFVQE